METINLVAKIIFLLGVIFFLVYGALTLVILWRFSFSRQVSLFLTVSFAVASLVLLINGLVALIRL